jgi:hypothetical protein
MDGSRFDAWTRRRVGIAAGAAAMLLGMPPWNEATTKRKRKQRKRAKARSHQCEPLGTDCNPHNDKRMCCAGLICGQVDLLGGRRCCHDRFGSCQKDADCCNNLKCDGAPEGFCNT